MVTTMKEYQQTIDNIEVLTPRIKALKQWYWNNKVRICPIRSHLATESWRETEGQPLHVRRAKLFEKICDNIPVAIFDHELIVGSKTAFPRGVGLQIDFNPITGLEVEGGDRRLNAELAKGVISDEDLEILAEDSSYWTSRSPGVIISQTSREVMGPIFDEIKSDVIYRAYAIFTRYSPSADYDKVVRLGLRGIIDEIDSEIARIQFTSANDGRRYSFLRAARICCEAQIRLARRYAELARKLATEESDEQRRRELKTITEVCEHVPENPARNFWEALQSVRFINLGLYLEDGNGNGNSLQRVDQYLYPFYKKDIEQGNLTRQQAAELLAAFWVKIATTEAVTPGTIKFSGAAFVDTRVILGGVDRVGNEASNELTHLILHVAAQVKLAVPIYLRWNRMTSRDLMLKAVWTNIQTGSEPAFHNDEHIIPGLVADGASLEDARDYVILGCAHPYPYGGPQGQTDYMNGAKVLELVMYNGYDPQTGKQLGIQTGDPRQFTSIDDWVNAFLKQWEYLYDILIRGYNIGELTQMEVYSLPFHSSLMPDCIEKGLDVHEGGGRYLQFMGDIFNKLYADVVDSLIAVNELVYKQRKITVHELLEACAKNFEGERGEHILKMLNTAPKYGNDLGEPEEMYRLLNDRITAIGLSRKSYFGYPKRDTKIGGALHMGHGKITGALPNGRKAGMPLSDGGISPCAGCDVRGPTATLRSVEKALDSHTNRSAIVNMKISKGLLKTDEEKNRLIDLIETFFRDYNGYQIQWNIEDRKVYMAAKANPEMYKNLIVRVGGFSAYFVELAPLLQDQIIARTEHIV